MFWRIVLALVVGLAAFPVPSQALMTLMETDKLKVTFGGFIQVDSIWDSTRSFNESVGNGPVARPNTAAGQAGRAQMSVRNTRFCLGVNYNESDGWKLKAFYEFDFNGYDPAPAAGATNVESGFYNNPTLRARHLYVQGEKNEWSLLAGQYWMALGWQPIYSIPTLQVTPVVAALSARTAQLRAQYSIKYKSGIQFQSLLALMRPPEREANLPGVEAGMRFVYDGINAGFAGGSNNVPKAQPLSLGISGLHREFRYPADLANPTGEQNGVSGSAIALNTLVPVIPSRDGKDVSHTLMLGGEFTTGKGYGDQFGGFTGGLLNPLQSAASGPNRNISLDAGIGGLDALNRFQLVKLQTFNVFYQYHFDASWRFWTSGGYTQISSSNIESLTGSQASANSLYKKNTMIFFNLFKEFNDQVRAGFEHSIIETTYVDGGMAKDKRFQFSLLFLF